MTALPQIAPYPYDRIELHISQIHAALVPTRQIFKIPNTIIGRLWLWYARRHRMPKTTILAKSRTPTKGHHYDYFGGLSRDHAKELGIYVNHT